MRYSRWLHVLLGVSLLSVGWSLVGAVLAGGLFDAEGVVLALYTLGALLGLLLTPVFFVALYLDAGFVRESASPWNPDRRLWVGGGVLCSLLAYALVRNPSVWIVALPYLVRRFRNPVPEAPDDDRRPQRS